RLATAPKSPAVDHRYVLLCDSLVLRLCRDYHYGRGCSAAATYRMPTVQLTRTHVRGSGPGMGWRRERPRPRFRYKVYVSDLLRSVTIYRITSHPAKEVSQNGSEIYGMARPMGRPLHTVRRTTRPARRVGSVGLWKGFRPWFSRPLGPAGSASASWKRTG